MFLKLKSFFISLSLVISFLFIHTSLCAKKEVASKYSSSISCAKSSECTAEDLLEELGFSSILTKAEIKTIYRKCLRQCLDKRSVRATKECQSECGIFQVLQNKIDKQKKEQEKQNMPEESSVWWSLISSPYVIATGITAVVTGTVAVIISRFLWAEDKKKKGKKKKGKKKIRLGDGLEEDLKREILWGGVVPFPGDTKGGCIFTYQNEDGYVEHEEVEEEAVIEALRGGEQMQAQHQAQDSRVVLEEEGRGREPYADLNKKVPERELMRFLRENFSSYVRRLDAGEILRMRMFIYDILDEMGIYFFSLSKEDLVDRIKGLRSCAFSAGRLQLSNLLWKENEEGLTREEAEARMREESEKEKKEKEEKTDEEAQEWKRRWLKRLEEEMKKEKK